MIKTLCFATTILLLIFLLSGCRSCCEDVWITTFDVAALECCKEQALKGDAEAQFEYGLWLIRVPESHQNIPEGIEWLKRSAMNKHFMAQVSVGLFLSKDEFASDINQDFVEAYAWLAAARQKDSMLSVEKKMSEEELSRAKALASEYISKYSSFE